MSNVEISRTILVKVKFKSAFDKVYTSHVKKIEDCLQVRLFKKRYTEFLSEFEAIYAAYSKTEEGTEQLKTYLMQNESFPFFPSSILNDESMPLTPEDRDFLEHAVLK